MIFDHCKSPQILKANCVIFIMNLCIGIGNMNIYHILLGFSLLKAFKVFRVFLCLSLFLIKYSQLCFLFPQCKDHL